MQGQIRQVWYLCHFCLLGRTLREELPQNKADTSQHHGHQQVHDAVGADVMQPSFMRDIADLQPAACRRAACPTTTL